MPAPLIALLLAEAQLALISNWLLEKPTLKHEAVAEALIASSHASLRSLLGLRSDISVLIPGEKLRVSYQNT